MPDRHFFRITRSTTRTLRHYDEFGLLAPQFVDGETGYRNYTNDQLARLHRILALKQLGLTLETIARVIEEPASIEACLQMKARELEETVQTESRRLREVNNLLK